MFSEHWLHVTRTGIKKAFQYGRRSRGRCLMQHPHSQVIIKNHQFQKPSAALHKYSKQDTLCDNITACCRQQINKANHNQTTIQIGKTNHFRGVYGKPT